MPKEQRPTSRSAAPRAVATRAAVQKPATKRASARPATASRKTTPLTLSNYIRPVEILPVDVKHFTYPNGLRVISERVQGASSLALGLWVDAGSQDESKRVGGIAHFIEHVVFKGTAGRSMREIMQSIEGRGGMLNAFTTKEHTCYYTWSRTAHLDEAVSVLFELATRPNFSERDLKREKGVVIEEIHGIEDEPDELVFDLFEQELFGDHPLGRPVLGSESSIERLTREDLVQFHKRHYNAKSLVITASGAHTHEELFGAVEKALKHVYATKLQRKIVEQPSHRPRKQVTHSRSGGQQSHIILGRKTPGIHWKYQPALAALITLLGVGMGSRLNLRLREELGLAYDATAFYSPFKEVGTTGLYIATTVDNEERAVKELYQQFRGLFRKPITRTELERTKEQLIGGVVLSMESVSNRMMRAGQNELHFSRYMLIEEELEKIARLTVEEVQKVAELLFKDERKLTLVSVRPEQSEEDEE